jgi:hypothetical protein
MSDEMIKKILVEMGLFSLALAYVGSESELMRTFRYDFSTLMRVCGAEGAA